MAAVNDSVDMLLVLGECQGNYRRASELYAVRYPERPTKSHMAFKRMKDRLRRHNSFQLPLQERIRPTTNNNNAINVLAAVAVNPHLSTRQISRDSGISKSSVSRILRNNRMHPYHISLHQELTGNDFIQRVNFCNWMQEKLAQDDTFLSKILFSDEATFSNIGAVNRHNMHFWSSVNPRWIQTVQYQHRWSLNVWCGILGDYLIGPHFFDTTLNGNTYTNFLLNKLPLLLEDIPLALRLIMWFQQDGAPPHYARPSRNALNILYPNRWIGRGSLTHWPPRSPDITPLDFFLWGFIKQKVFSTKPTTPDDMKERIRQACADVTPQMLAEVRRSLHNRINKCLEVNGNNFEHLLQ
ncbi:unnamed protein product [Lasius platythorax]|uniref:DUF4817 domain-containing protein n=1 Tax=Lasius platythorax TaxID=488582 RepID=A0AAV2P8H3_9HYME